MKWVRIHENFNKSRWSKNNCYVKRIVVTMTIVNNRILFCWIIRLCGRFMHFWAALDTFGHFGQSIGEYHSPSLKWVRSRSAHGRTWTPLGCPWTGFWRGLLVIQAVENRSICHPGHVRHPIPRHPWALGKRETTIMLLLTEHDPPWPGLTDRSFPVCTYQIFPGGWGFPTWDAATLTRALQTQAHR